MCQAVVGQGPDAGERRAKFVGHVAGEFALRTHAVIESLEQRVDGIAKALHFTRGADHRHRRQVAHVSPVQSLLQLTQGTQVMPYAAPEPDGQQAQQQQLRKQGIDKQSPDQRGTPARGLRNHHAIGVRQVMDQHDRAQMLALVVDVREAAARTGLGHRDIQIGFTRNQRIVRSKYGEEDGLVLVEQHRCNLARGQQELEAALAGLHVGRQRIGIVEHAPIEGLFGKVVCNRQRNHGAEEPGEGQRQQHVVQYPMGQRPGTSCTGRVPGDNHAEGAPGALTTRRRR